VPSSSRVEVAARPAVRRKRRGPVASAPDLVAIAVGGGLGSIARYGLSVALPAGHGFPWAIFIVNVSGCFLLGLLMIYLLEVWPPRQYLRPFLAVGLLGGYTTFSTYAAGVMTLLTSRSFALADAYALTSIVAALVAVWAGMKTGRLASERRARPEESGGGR
jgi:fluoride exporter